MPNRFICSILALIAAFAFLPAPFGGTAAQARSAEAKKAGPTPDLTGVWSRSRRPPDRARRYTVFDLIMSISIEEPPMTPWAEARYEAAKPEFGPRAVPIAESNDPLGSCFPPGLPRIYLIRGEPMEIVQIPGRVIMLFEYDHFVRQIYTDGRPHNTALGPTWMGDSIGKWQGDTLVVDAVGFNDKTWIDMAGHPHSEAMHLVERIRRVDHNTLQNDLTIEDPKAYTKPWGGRLIFVLKPGWSLGEMICEDNINFSDFQKKISAKPE
jgi:hypothetical protein